MQTKLSILIPSLEVRKRLLEKLLSDLELQCEGGDVEIITDIDRGQVSIGQKRQRMLLKASGEYVVFIDDDDKVHDAYVDTILKACESNADCITFNLAYKSGRNTDPIPVNFSLKHKRDSNETIPFERLPNHLCPVKRNIALGTGFKSIKYGEDADYARRLKRYLKTSHHIDVVMYYYLDYKK